MTGALKILCIAVLLTASHLAGAATKTKVYVLGTLYSAHANTPAYTTDVLKRVILDINPDVLVLDVTPDEFRNRRVHESKIEYSEAIFPYLAETRITAYPAEPDEPAFSEIQTKIQAILKHSEQTNPNQNATLDAYELATFKALALHWKSVAAVQDHTTSRALASRSELFNTLNPGFAKIAEDWDAHTAQAGLRAAKSHPGKRVLILTGIQNRASIQKRMQSHRELDVVDIEVWLQERGH